MKNVHPLDNVVTFSDRMTLKLGGKTIELLYVDDPYNPGDIAVWLPESGVMHAGFVGYIDRHPDIRPDYSHGTTWGMLRQLDAFSALKPRVMIPAHGPLGDVKDLHALTDYLLLARKKVLTMMQQGLPLAAIVKQFHMNEYKGWDRESHFAWIAETLYRELQGQGPQIVPLVEAAARRHDPAGRAGGAAADRAHRRRAGGAAADHLRHRHRRRRRPLAAQGRDEAHARSTSCRRAPMRRSASTSTKWRSLPSDGASACRLRARRRASKVAATEGAFVPQISYCADRLSRGPLRLFASFHAGDRTGGAASPAFSAAADPEPSGRSSSLGIPVDFILFGLTLLGVALFHHHTLQVALTGLAAITLYKLVFTGLQVRRRASPGSRCTCSTNG